jgi:hypothetical protein
VTHCQKQFTRQAAGAVGARTLDQSVQAIGDKNEERGIIR